MTSQVKLRSHQKSSAKNPYQAKMHRSPGKIKRKLKLVPQRQMLKQIQTLLFKKYLRILLELILQQSSKQKNRNPRKVARKKANVAKAKVDQAMMKMIMNTRTWRQMGRLQKPPQKAKVGKRARRILRMHLGQQVENRKIRRIQNRKVSPFLKAIPKLLVKTMPLLKQRQTHLKK